MPLDKYQGVNSVTAFDAILSYLFKTGRVNRPVVRRAPRRIVESENGRADSDVCVLSGVPVHPPRKGCAPYWMNSWQNQNENC